MDELDDATFTRIRDLTIQVDRQERRCQRLLGTGRNRTLLRAMQAKTDAMAERHGLLYGQAAGDTLRRQANRQHELFARHMGLPWPLPPRRPRANPLLDLLVGLNANLEAPAHV